MYLDLYFFTKTGLQLSTQDKNYVIERLAVDFLRMVNRDREESEIMDDHHVKN